MSGPNSVLGSFLRKVSETTEVEIGFVSQSGVAEPEVSSGFVSRKDIARAEVELASFRRIASQGTTSDWVRFVKKQVEGPPRPPDLRGLALQTATVRERAFTRYTSSTAARSNSATLQACARHP